MKEKVYCLFDYHDYRPLSGVSDFKGQHCYFSCIFSEELDDFTDLYDITFIDETTFELEISNWKYWLFWMNQDKIPHPSTYANIRKTESFDSIMPKDFFSNKKNWKQAEMNYQNQLLIDHYLQTHLPTIQVKGLFYIKNWTDSTVEWIV